jgi:hypothetical protein
MGGIFCDLAKAFDCVNHEILLAKLHFYGIQWVSEDWFRSCLINRKQQLEIKSPNTTKMFFSAWGALKHVAPLWSIRPLLFLTNINHLPFKINPTSQPILFADDTSDKISRINFEDFCSVSNLVLSHMIIWFAVNMLVLNLDKTSIAKFITDNSSHSTLCISYKEKYTGETVNIKFIGLQLYNHLNWKNHNEQMIPKLSAACYAIRSMVHISSINTVNWIYYAYFHSVIKYRIILEVRLSPVGRFSLYKRKLPIMAAAHPRTSCRSLFKQLQVLSVPYQHILSLTNFTVNNH